MPTETTPNPPLHLVNPADRSRRLGSHQPLRRRRPHDALRQTKAEDDYAALSNQVATTLNQVAHTPDPVQRLAIVEEARRTLADWPENHYGYRQAEVRQMLSLLDEAIADLRAARGAGRFDLTLSAFADPPTAVEPLLPPPTSPKESIEQMLAAARAVDTRGRAHLAARHRRCDDRPRQGALPADWAAATRADAADAMRVGAAARSFVPGAHRANDGVGEPSRPDRRRAGLERLLLSIPNDATPRSAPTPPDAVNALVAAVEAKLDAARQLQLARDRWALRAPDLRTLPRRDRRADGSLHASCSRRSKASSRLPARRRRRWRSSSAGWRGS